MIADGGFEIRPADIRDYANRPTDAIKELASILEQPRAAPVLELRLQELVRVLRRTKHLQEPGETLPGGNTLGLEGRAGRRSALVGEPGGPLPGDVECSDRPAQRRRHALADSSDDGVVVVVVHYGAIEVEHESGNHDAESGSWHSLAAGGPGPLSPSVLRSAMPGDAYECLLFDLGGVLVRLGGVAAMQSLAGLDSEDEVWSRWLACPWVRDFERGLCSAADFANGVVADWRLTVGAPSFLELFESWPQGPFEGAAELVGEVREQVKVACLSNSNSLHWERVTALGGLGAMFDATFLSHELALIKPDREIFEHVAACFDGPADRLVFLDDNELNVAQAKTVGFTAARVRGADEARSALVNLGVLSVPGVVRRPPSAPR